MWCLMNNNLCFRYSSQKLLASRQLKCFHWRRTTRKTLLWFRSGSGQTQSQINKKSTPYVDRNHLRETIISHWNEKWLLPFTGINGKQFLQVWSNLEKWALVVKISSTSVNAHPTQYYFFSSLSATKIKRYRFCVFMRKNAGSLDF